MDIDQLKRGFKELKKDSRPLHLDVGGFVQALAREYRAFTSDEFFEIYMVGSRANGTNRENSDYDINIVGSDVSLQDNISFQLGLRQRMREYIPEGWMWELMDIRLGALEEGKPSLLLLSYS